MDKFRKKLYKKTIYILSDNAEKRLKRDYSVSENISYLYSYYYDHYSLGNFQEVGNIIVYKTFFGYKEFITDKIVPFLKWKGNSRYERKYKLTDEQPIFIEGNLSCSIATLDDLKKYLEKELNPSKYQIKENYNSKELVIKYYLEELNELFKHAWNVYNSMISQSDYSTEKARKKYEKNQDKEKIKELKRIYSGIGEK